jgi:zinc resistance-associated protein
MRKQLLIAAAAAALLLPVLSSGAYAEPPRQEAGAQWKLTDEDRAALVDARVAGLKAGLKLTPAQEKNWPAVETAIRDSAKARAAHWKEWAEKSKEHEEHHNLIEKLQHHAKAMETRAAELTKFADAVKPLYDSLDEGQKHRLVVILHAIEGHHGHHFGGGEGHGWGGGEGGPDHKG